MGDPVESILGACRDLSDGIPGLEIVDGAEYDLRISDPVLALWLQPLSHRSVNDVPNPPNPFATQTTFLENEYSSPIPWMSPTSEYEDRYLAPYDEFVVVFADYGEVTNRSSASTHERRAKRQVEQRQEELSGLDIEPEQQIIIPFDGRVRESIAHRLAAYYLKTRGWFVTTDFLYLPAGWPGVPDIVAWKSPLTEALRATGLVQDGAHLEELAYLRPSDEEIGGQVPSIPVDTPTETLVAEVKGEDRSMGEAHTQLQDYLGWNTFDSGYSVVPGYRGYTQSGAGTLTFDDRGFEFNPDEGTHSVSDQKQQLVEYMDAAARQALLCGMSLSELTELAESSGTDSAETPHQLAEQLCGLDSETILGEVVGRAQ